MFAKRLQVRVNDEEHLPLAELPPLGVEVSLLEEAKVQLNGRTDVAVWPREDDWHAQLLDCRSHLCRAVVRRVVEEHDRFLAPVRVLRVERLRELVEVADHDA